jgi:hypothetical protein
MKPDVFFTFLEILAGKHTFSFGLDGGMEN